MFLCFQRILKTKRKMLRGSVSSLSAAVRSKGGSRRSLNSLGQFRSSSRSLESAAILPRLDELWTDQSIRTAKIPPQMPQNNGCCVNIQSSHYQLRTFATSAQKRAMAQQEKKKGGSDNNNKNPKEKPEAAPTSGDTDKPTKSPPPSSSASPPTSLIRTDFALDSSSTKPHELILPSGYEIPLTSSIIDDDNDDHQTKNGGATSTSRPGPAFSYVDYKELYDPKIHLPSAPQDWTDYESATPLWEELAAQIGVLGRPMTVAEFMQHALLHPKFGYYSQPMRNRVEDNDNDDDDIFSDDEEDSDDAKNNNDNPIFGPRGDFVTAPEICQVFGESIQVWMVTQWEAMGKPKAIQWVEFGPGRGTLMADMVRFALSRQQYPSAGDGAGTSDKLEEYGNALEVIHLIEPSHPLRQKQQASLQDQLGDLVNWEFHNPVAGDSNAVEAIQNSVETSTNPTIQVHWHDSFASLTAMIMRRKQRKMGHESTTASNTDEQGEADVSNMPLFVICQEFFDALPVHAFEMTKDGWRERMVDMAIRDEMMEDDDEDEDGGTQSNTKNPMSASATQINGIEGAKRPRLRIVLAPEVTPALKTLLRVDEDGKIPGDPASSNLKAEPGQVIEVCPEGILVVQDIAAVLEQQGGAAIIVHYGEEGSTDSLRGFWKHKQTHFLSLPGQTDVTADVDFTALKHAVNHARPNRIQLLTAANENMSTEGKHEKQKIP